jgi:uncharacterized membrane protein YebE (DUF533 family)
LGKVALGVAGGVAVVVALPIAGPIGAVTAVGALVAGGLGAAAGGVTVALGDSDEDKQRADRAEHSAATMASKAEGLEQRMAEAAGRMQEDKAWEEFLIALFAVGICAANCDGKIAESEKQELDEFVSGISEIALPKHVKDSINALYASPPSLKAVMHYVERVDQQHRALFDDVIDVVVQADGTVDRDEIAFKAAWKSATAAVAA